MNATKSRADDLEAALRSEGVRITRQRTAVIRALSEAEDHPDAIELHRRAQVFDPAVSLATVYRTLATLEDKSVVHRHAFDGAPARFETADAPHHDHIVDLDTGEVVEFHSPEIEALQKQIADTFGYVVEFHKLELYGRKKRTGEGRS